VATGADGSVFDREMLSVNGEVYRRYFGHNKVSQKEPLESERAAEFRESR
jgi:hypothetical protein